jgi:hypothetical protein
MTTLLSRLSFRCKQSGSSDTCFKDSKDRERAKKLRCTYIACLVALYFDYEMAVSFRPEQRL